ncbi:MAG: helix-turn-helix domain-containing protein [Proteobacteria bacterium]|nr:helix-turn-helix domain-containing protein [Pseudomonadota bacterium]
MNLLSDLITSTTRIKILMRLFFNPNSRAYLQELAKEFGISPSQVSYELGQLTRSGLLESERNGRYIFYSANQTHPLFPELHGMVMKAVGADRILETIIGGLGELDLALLVGDYAEGRDTGIIDLILVGKIDEENLRLLTDKVEKHINRKIRNLILTPDEFVRLKPSLDKGTNLILWGGMEAERA